MLKYLFRRGHPTQVLSPSDHLRQRLLRAGSLSTGDLMTLAGDALALRCVTMDWSVDGRLFRFYLWCDVECLFDVSPDPEDPGQMATFRRLCEALAQLLGKPATIRHEHGDFAELVVEPSR